MAAQGARRSAVIVSWIVALIAVATAATFGLFWQSAAQDQADAEATVVELKAELDALG